MGFIIFYVCMCLPPQETFQGNVFRIKLDIFTTSKQDEKGEKKEAGGEERSWLAHWMR